MTSLREKYPVKVDWNAQQYIGINLTWNYTEGQVLMGMKDYVQQALKQFKHERPQNNSTMVQARWNLTNMVPKFNIVTQLTIALYQ